MNSTNKIIELYCEIDLNPNENEPKITKLFPVHYDNREILKVLGDFVFPCHRIKSSAEQERALSPINFSFVLTNINKSYKYGFCRQDIPSSSSSKASVLLSVYPWHDIFLKILNVLANLRQRVSERQFEQYLNSIQEKHISDENINFIFADINGIILHECSFRKPHNLNLPSIPESHNLNLFYNYIEPKTMIEIFAALLAERRLIFLSNNFDKLSSCVQASSALIYPMIWQHIFIPLLPYKLRDYLLAPLPMIIGCPSMVFNAVQREEIGEVVIINCDFNTVSNPFQDVNDLPLDIVNNLKKQLNSATNDLRGDRISKLFLNSLVQLIGGYRDAIKYTGNKMHFSNEVFIESQLPQYKHFVKKLVNLQMFQQFIEERIMLIQNNSELSDEFEIEVELHAAKMGKKINQYKEFIRNIKGKANPAMKNAVKSVKATCKELKSKIKDNPSPKPDKLDFNNIGVDRSSTFQHYCSIQTNYTSSDSPSASTSSQSSSSDMNILQELEAQGIFTNTSTKPSISNEKSQNECNLIDLSDDSLDKKLQYNFAKPNVENTSESLENSEFLNDVINVLNRNNWTKFD